MSLRMLEIGAAYGIRVDNGSPGDAAALGTMFANVFEASAAEILWLAGAAALAAWWLL